MAALELMRHLGVNYKAAWRIKQTTHVIHGHRKIQTRVDPVVGGTQQARRQQIGVLRLAFVNDVVEVRAPGQQTAVTQAFWGIGPKPYPWLKIPRAQARRQVEKHGHAWETK